MLSSEDTARLKELGKLGKNRTEAEQAEFEALQAKAKAAKAAGKAAKTQPPSVPPNPEGAKSGDPVETGEDKKAVSIDTAGASHVVTIRNGKAVKVWFKGGKEIGVEDAG